MSAVQLLRDQKLVRNVVHAERKWCDLSTRFQRLETPFQVFLHARGSLITFLRHFCEELHDNGRELRRYSFCTLGRRHWLNGEMAMNPLHWIPGYEWEYSCHHSVQHHTEAIEIASRIGRQVHASSLFRRQGGQTHTDWLWRFGPFSR